MASFLHGCNFVLLSFLSFHLFSVHGDLQKGMIWPIRAFWFPFWLLAGISARFLTLLRLIFVYSVIKEPWTRFRLHAVTISASNPAIALAALSLIPPGNDVNAPNPANHSRPDWPWTSCAVSTAKSSLAYLIPINSFRPPFNVSNLKVANQLEENASWKNTDFGKIATRKSFLVICCLNP